jgi:hypothetical protein
MQDKAVTKLEILRLWLMSSSIFDYVIFVISSFLNKYLLPTLIALFFICSAYAFYDLILKSLL